MTKSYTITLIQALQSHITYIIARTASNYLESRNLISITRHAYGCLNSCEAVPLASGSAVHAIAVCLVWRGKISILCE